MGLGSLLRGLSGGSAGRGDSASRTGGDTGGDVGKAPGKVRIRFRFVGSVQAVGFRWTTMNLAKASGATGWVRNEHDGSVTAEIQGLPDQVEAVVDGLDQYYNASSWAGGFQIARREYIELRPAEIGFKVAYT